MQEWKSTRTAWISRCCSERSELVRTATKAL